MQHHEAVIGLEIGLDVPMNTREHVHGLGRTRAVHRDQPVLVVWYYDKALMRHVHSVPVTYFAMKPQSR